MKNASIFPATKGRTGIISTACSAIVRFMCWGDRCGGKFSYLPNGYKDCSKCLYPHLRENYEKITGRYSEILAAIRHTGDIG